MSAPPQPLSSADTAWLHMDRPSNLMVINSILLFDERMDWQRLAQVVRTRLVEPYTRFRACVSEGRLAVGGGAHWEEDRRFDLARHLHRMGLRAPGDEAALQELAGDLASIPLDRAKPLWDMYLIDGPGAGSAVIVRMHHCIADGIALAEVMLSLTDSAAPARPRAARAAIPQQRPRARVEALADTPLGTLGRALSWTGAPLREGAGTARRVAGALADGGRMLADPARALRLTGAIGADARTLAKLVLTPRDTRSPLKRDFGARRAVAWSTPLSLERVKAIAHAQGATVNDVLLAAVSGALRTYLLARGEQPQEIRTLVPVNLRPADGSGIDELGNRFGLVFLALPVDRASRRERLVELKQRMDAIKRSPEGPVSYALLEAAGLAPVEVERRVIDFFTAKASAVMTNVPGPRQTVYLAGSPLRTVLVWAPTAGSVGMSASIFSYDGRITVGVLVHTALVPDPRAILEPLHREVAAMARLAPAGPARASDGRGA